MRNARTRGFERLRSSSSAKSRSIEKLYDELSSLTEDTVPTAHEKIRIFTGIGMPDGDRVTWIGYLREICQARETGRLVVALKEIVLDYSPSTHLPKRVIETRGQRAGGGGGGFLTGPQRNADRIMKLDTGLVLSASCRS